MSYFYDVEKRGIFGAQKGSFRDKKAESGVDRPYVTLRKFQTMPPTYKVLCLTTRQTHSMKRVVF